MFSVIQELDLCCCQAFHFSVTRQLCLFLLAASSHPFSQEAALPNLLSQLLLLPFLRHCDCLQDALKYFPFICAWVSCMFPDVWQMFLLRFLVPWYILSPGVFILNGELQQMGWEGTDWTYCFRIWTISGHLRTQKWALGFHKNRGCHEFWPFTGSSVNALLHGLLVYLMKSGNWESSRDAQFFRLLSLNLPCIHSVALRSEAPWTNLILSRAWDTAIFWYKTMYWLVV
jgi:hypothetical protein